MTATSTIEQLRKKRQMITSNCVRDGHTCSRVDEAFCSVYAFPKAKWRLGDCPMADRELRTDQPKADKGKVRVGQQKQRRRR